MLILLLVIQVITVIAIVLILRTLFYRNLRTALSRLNALHEENLVKEEQLKEELNRGKQERQNEAAKGVAEAKEIVERAKKEVEKIKIKSEEEAKLEVAKIIQRAEEAMEKQKQVISAEVKKEAQELAVEIIRSTFTGASKEGLQRMLIDEVISEIGSLSQDKFTVTADKVKVVSAFPLSDTERRNLAKIISEKLHSQVALEEHLEPALVTGLTLEIGALMIDGSLKNKLNKAIPYLNQA